MSNMKFPVYQIDFSAVAAGKRVAATKRRVRWRFGFPNLQAIAEGRSGTDCRGEEHEIVVIWSVTSGKRQILMDGREVHYSSTRAGILDHSWSSKGNHIMKVVCHASPPLSANPGFRQYDLFIDGQSFFLMPKVYELGVRGAAAETGRVPGRYDYNPSASAYSSPRSLGPPSIPVPRSQAEEEEELQRAINASLEESRKHLEKKDEPPNGENEDYFSNPAPGSDLLDMGGGGGGGPPPTMPQSTTAASGFARNFSDNQSVMSYSSAPTYIAPTNGQELVVAATQPASQYGMTPPPQQGYGQPPPSQPAYAQPPAQYGAPPPPQPPVQAYSAPASDYGGGYSNAGAPPQQQNYSSPSNDGGFFQQTASTGSYGSPGSNDPLAVGGHSFDDPFAPKPPSRSEIMTGILSAYGGGVASPSPAPNSGGGGYATPTHPTLSMNQYAETPNENGSHGGGGGLSMNALTVTQEDEDEPKNDLDVAMKKLVNFDHIDEPAEEKLKLTMKQQEENEKQKQKNKSKPLPPAAHRMVGSQATLSQISTVKGPKQAREDIMRAPAQLFSPDAAMAGALVVHGAPNQGPPPLPPRGFGVVHGKSFAAPPPPTFQPQGVGGYGQQQQQQQQQQYQQPMQGMAGGQQPGYPPQQAPQGYAQPYPAQPAAPYAYR